MSEVLMLVAHGSPDPDWAEPVVRLEQRIRQLDPHRAVGLCYLAFIPPLLEDAVRDAVVAQGRTHIRIVPVFLSAGGRHLKVDLPERVLAMQVEHPTVRIVSASGALGADDEVVTALAYAALRRSD